MTGDAAHTMTPAAGAGIKYAIEDAVVASNVLAEPLRARGVRLSDLAEVQRRREWPTRLIQAFGAFGLRQLGGRLRSRSVVPLPGWPPGLFVLPFVARLAARMMAFGVWRVHVES